MPAAIPAWKRPQRPSFVTVVLGKVYVATAKPDGPGYALRPYVPGEPVDIDPDADSPERVLSAGMQAILGSPVA